MNITDFFSSTVDPNNISVYIGRVIKLDDNFESNGVLYVDLKDPTGKDLDKGSKTANKATATYALRTLYRCWENPPEIQSKSQFEGSMSFTSSGDFHLRNYCFDMMTQTWFMTVSTALNAIGIVNVPPVMIGIDTTPFPGQAVSINVASSAKEVADEAIQSSLDDLSSDKTITNSYEIPSVEEVKNAVGVTHRTRDIRSTYTGNDPVIKVIDSIVTPIKGILNYTVKPLIEFLDCVSILFQIYEKHLDNVSEITIPITQFATIKEDGSVQDVSPLDNLAIKTDLQNKISQFKIEIENNLSQFTDNIESTLIDKVYDPIAYMYSLVNTQIYDIINPIKTKIKDTIIGAIKEPLSQLVSYIAMAIQPVVSSLPTIVQLVVKLALKKLLQVLMGQPIKLLLSAVIEPIESIIDAAVDKIQSMISEIISTAINTIINPLVGGIQESISSLVPFFDMSRLKSYLTEILNNQREFPKIYIGTNAVKPYKDFDEINWSEPEELSAMLTSLIEEVNKNGYIPPVSQITSKELQEEICRWYGVIQGADTLYKGSSLLNILIGDEDSVTIHPNEPLKEGTIKSGSYTDKELFYKKVSSKEDFLPYFTKVHTPDMYRVVLGATNTMFEKVTSSKWLTNNVPYIDIEIQGEKKRLICGSNVSSGQTSEPVSVRIPESTTPISLYPKYVYESRLVKHIQVDSNDPPVGEDLVPVVNSNNQAIPFKIQSVRAEDNELLYLDGNTTRSFKEIASRYYIPPTTSLLAEDYILNNIIDLLNRENIDPTLSSLSIEVNQVYQDSILSKCLQGLKINNSSYSYLLKRDDQIAIIKTYLPINPVSPYYQDNKLTLTIISNNPITSSGQIFSDNQTEIKMVIELNHILDSQNNHVYSKLSYSLQTQAQSMVSPGTYASYWDNTVSVLSYKLSSPDINSTDYYCWMISGLVDSEPKEIPSNKKEVNSIVNTMLQQSVSAIGQEEGFNPSILMKSVVGKAFSSLDTITDSLSEVTSLVQSSLERVEDLKKIDEMVDTIEEVGDKVKEVADTAGPALEATAKAASSVAIQSCSMTQSSTGKDFTFNSGTEYGLSTTTTSKAQLPYCKELSREQLLEPNCKVLVLAIGAGKQNLYVVDILT